VLANPAINHTHFDYSMGVLLIRHLGGSLREQLADLLHDQLLRELIQSCSKAA
jgi:hypothetical protein